LDVTSGHDQDIPKLNGLVRPLASPEACRGDLQGLRNQCYAKALLLH